MQPEAIDEFAAERSLRDRALTSLVWTEPPPHDVAYLRTAIDAQGLVFMGDLFPAISAYLRSRPWGSNVRILDVGAGSAAGADWLGQMLSGTFMGVHAEVTALELNPVYTGYVRLFRPNVRYLPGVLLEHLPPDDVYDIVIASHVIEHVDDPSDFVRQLRGRARGRVFVYAPFEEEPPLAQGHLHRFTRAALDALHPESVETISSLGWRKEASPTDRSRCFLAQFSGGAR